MTLEMKLEDESGASEHRLDLRPDPNGMSGSDGGGRSQFLLDSGELKLADWSTVEPGVYSILLDHRSYDARATRSAALERGVAQYEVSVGAHRFLVQIHDPRTRRRAGAADATRGPQEIVAPM